MTTLLEFQKTSYLFEEFIEKTYQLHKACLVTVLNSDEGEEGDNRFYRIDSTKMQIPNMIIICIKPKNRTNFGKSTLTYLIHFYISTKQTAKELLSFVYKTLINPRKQSIIIIIIIFYSSFLYSNLTIT